MTAESYGRDLMFLGVLPTSEEFVSFCGANANCERVLERLHDFVAATKGPIAVGIDDNVLNLQIGALCRLFTNVNEQFIRSTMSLFVDYDSEHRIDIMMRILNHKQQSFEKSTTIPHVEKVLTIPQEETRLVCMIYLFNFCVSKGCGWWTRIL